MFGAALFVPVVTPWGAGAEAAGPVDFQVAGGPEDLTRLLRASSPLLSAERADRLDAQDLLAAARAEYAGLLAALYSRGYFGPVISVKVDGREAATIAPLDFPDRVGRIVVMVTPGPQFAFSRAEIAPLAPGTELPTGFALGKPAETGVIRDAAKAAVDGWRAVGHAKAEPGAQSLVVEHAAQTLSASIEMKPGPRLRFGEFTLRGQDRMREERIRAIAGFPEGKVFDPEALERSANRLRRAGVFRSVALTEADEPGQDGTLDVATTVIEDLPRRYGFGGEVSTLDGLSANAFWIHRNLWGGAERLRFDATVDNIGAQNNGIDYRLGVTLDRPATFTPDTLVSIGAAVARLDDDNDEIIDLATLSFGATQFVSDRLTLRAGLEARAENVTDSTGDYEYRALAFPLAATMDARNDKFDPTQGYFVNAGIAPFVGFDETDSGRSPDAGRARIPWRRFVHRGRPASGVRGTGPGGGGIRHEPCADATRLSVLFGRRRHGAGPSLSIAGRECAVARPDDRRHPVHRGVGRDPRADHRDDRRGGVL